MQKLEEQLQYLNETIDKVKGKVKYGARDVERLRVERAEIERQAKASQNEAEDDRVIGLYDWYVRLTYYSKRGYRLNGRQVYCVNGAKQNVVLSGVFAISFRE